MQIGTMKQSIMLAREAGITIFIWGKHGLGKSSIVKQVCAQNELGFVDMRCSQLEASDIRGFPQAEKGRTTFLPPADMPSGEMSWKQFIDNVGKAPDDEQFRIWTQSQPKLKKGILFLDEINRAQDDVLQAVFQLVLDRKVGQYVLPDGWSIAAAGNPMEGYMVNGFTDPAFLDRFTHVILSAGNDTLPEWVDYMADAHGQDATKIIEFASQNVKFLDGEIETDMGFSIQPSRRSWEAVTKVEKAFAEGNFHERAKGELIAGLVGRECATNYTRYNCPVKPLDVLEGVKKIKAKLGKLSRNQMIGLMWGLVSLLKEKVDESDKHANCALDFAEYICKKYPEKDLVVAFCKALLTRGNNSSKSGDSLRAAAISNPTIAMLLAKVQPKGGGKTFIQRLTDRPDLQKLLSETAWGS